MFINLSSFLVYFAFISRVSLSRGDRIAPCEVIFWLYIFYIYFVEVVTVAVIICFVMVIVVVLLLLFCCCFVVVVCVVIDVFADVIVVAAVVGLLLLLLWLYIVELLLLLLSLLLLLLCLLLWLLLLLSLLLFRRGRSFTRPISHSLMWSMIYSNRFVRLTVQLCYFAEMVLEWIDKFLRKLGCHSVKHSSWLTRFFKLNNIYDVIIIVTVIIIIIAIIIIITIINISITIINIKNIMSTIAAAISPPPPPSSSSPPSSTSLSLSLTLRISWAQKQQYFFHMCYTFFSLLSSSSLSYHHHLTITIPASISSAAATVESSIYYWSLSRKLKRDLCDRKKLRQFSGNTPVSRYFNTAVQFDKRLICTGLISIGSAYQCAFYCQTIAFFRARILYFTVFVYLNSSLASVWCNL